MVRVRHPRDGSGGARGKTASGGKAYEAPP
jgi:hypothetical protein